jgi:small subunit ribosomal protein S16
MAVKIRMRQQGRKNRQTFRLVVTDIRHPRDGKYVETLGSYDPHKKQNNLMVNAERLSYWLSKGAELSESAERLVKGVAPEVIRALQEKKNAARAKQAAIRRKKKAAPQKKQTPVARKVKSKDES